MRILHLPANIASQISITVRALCDIGIDARGIVISNNKMQENEGIRKFELSAYRKYPIRRTIQTFSWSYAFIRAVQWADVIHWYYNDSYLPKELDLKYIKYLNKPTLIEFWGTDIRIPEIAMENNPYLTKLFSDPNNDYHISYEKSHATQERFSRYGFKCLIPGTKLLSYIQHDLFPSPIRTQARIFLSEFNPKYPNTIRQRPVVVHMPTRLMTKGTPSVLKAIKQLKNHYDFEFKLIHGIPHKEAMNMIQDCDIMLDQFVIGGFGISALESMAMGKPVICYITPLIKDLPHDCPVINANQDNLAGVLRDLLKDGPRRNRVGRQSRAFVEKYYDAHKIARDLVKIYEELIEKNPKKRK